ncbi:MAG: hypothetical protein ACK5QE_04820, partial [Sphingobacteriia bacterium]
MKQCLVLLIALCAVGTTTRAQQQDEQLKTYLTELETVEAHYAAARQADPANKGATRLATSLGGVTAALQNYQAGGL